MFAALDPAVRNGWEVVPEQLTFEDSPFKFHVRLELLRLHDPSLLALRDRVRVLQDPAAIAHELSTIDPTLVLHDDLIALFFTLGSGILTQLMSVLLAEVRTDEDINNLAAIASIRHEILLSYQPVSA